MGIQMKQKELTKTFMITNWKKPLGLQDLYQDISALWGLNFLEIVYIRP